MEIQTCGKYWQTNIDKATVGRLFDGYAYGQDGDGNAAKWSARTGRSCSHDVDDYNLVRAWSDLPADEPEPCPLPDFALPAGWVAAIVRGDGGKFRWVNKSQIGDMDRRELPALLDAFLSYTCNVLSEIGRGKISEFARDCITKLSVRRPPLDPTAAPPVGVLWPDREQRKADLWTSVYAASVNADHGVIADAELHADRAVKLLDARMTDAGFVAPTEGGK